MRNMFKRNNTNTTKTTTNTGATDDYATLVAEMNDKGWAVFFDYIEDETSTIEASITDNFVETNHADQDHIAIKPRIYRLRGCVGEVTFENNSKWIEYLTDKINNNPILKKTKIAVAPINAVSPVISNYTQLAVNVVKQIENSFNRYKQMLENTILPSKSKLPIGEKQETVVAILNRILEQRIPVILKGLKFEKTLSADAPDKKFERKYYLQSVSAHQGGNNFISDIEVTIKEFRIATTKIVDLDPNKYGGYEIITNEVNNTTETNTGEAKGDEVKPETVVDTINKAGDSMSKKVKEALKGHPALYNATKNVYYGLYNIGDFATKLVGIK